jgi:hypothetical protein
MKKLVALLPEDIINIINFQTKSLMATFTWRYDTMQEKDYAAGTL